jgi:S-adenosyl methyltransferase
VADWEREVPAGVDTSLPSIARVYDYVLGGKDNFECDRVLTEQLKQIAPEITRVAVQNRKFLRRAVRFIAEQGVNQFIDIGTGLPTQDNVHQVARRAHPDARVVYVDNDPIVSVHGSALIAEDHSTAFILQDVRRTEEILNHPDTRRLINFEEPVAALYISFLHQIPDRDDPAGLVRTMMSYLAPGSFVAMSHLVSADPQLRKQLTDLMLNATEGNWGRVRTRTEVNQFFTGLEPITPGLVEITTWRPDGTAAEEQTFNWIEYGGVARTPSEPGTR